MDGLVETWDLHSIWKKNFGVICSVLVQHILQDGNLLLIRNMYIFKKFKYLNWNIQNIYENSTFIIKISDFHKTLTYTLTECFWFLLLRVVIRESQNYNYYEIFYSLIDIKLILKNYLFFKSHKEDFWQVR